MRLLIFALILLLMSSSVYASLGPLVRCSVSGKIQNISYDEQHDYFKLNITVSQAITINLVRGDVCQYTVGKMNQYYMANTGIDIPIDQPVTLNVTEKWIDFITFDNETWINVTWRESSNQPMLDTNISFALIFAIAIFLIITSLLIAKQMRKK